MSGGSVVLDADFFTVLQLGTSSAQGNGVCCEVGGILLAISGRTYKSHGGQVSADTDCASEGLGQATVRGKAGKLVWRQWRCLRRLSADRDFQQRVLWKKLQLGLRLSKVYPAAGVCLVDDRGRHMANFFGAVPFPACCLTWCVRPLESFETNRLRGLNPVGQ